VNRRAHLAAKIPRNDLIASENSWHRIKLARQSLAALLSKYVYICNIYRNIDVVNEKYRLPHSTKD